MDTAARAGRDTKGAVGTFPPQSNASQTLASKVIVVKLLWLLWQLVAVVETDLAYDANI